MRPPKTPAVCYLNIMAVGMRGRIVDITATGLQRHQILSLGLIEGNTIAVQGKNPLKKSIHIIVKGRGIELNEELAKQVLVKIEF